MTAVAVQAPQPIQVPPPPSLLQPPPQLPQPASGRMPDLEANHREVAKAYHQLAAQLCALLTFLESATNDCDRYLSDQAAQAPELRQRPR
jgi:hypothetical protein